MAGIAINYTSRDFESIKADLITVIKNKLASSSEGKVWDDSDPADFAVALIEAFAYVGDITNYYIDRAANEAYLPTAVQRASILKLARALNYVPSGFTQSTVVLTASNSTDEAILIPQGTQLSVTVPNGDKTTLKVLFTVSEEVEIPEKEGGTAGTAEVTVSCGENVSLRSSNLAVGENGIDGEYLTTSSSGFGNQSYKLKVENPVDSSIEVFVEDNEAFIPWERVEHLYDNGPSSNVYSAVINADNSVTINFGDGVAGAIPTQGAEIKVRYSVLPQGGPIGNVPANLRDWKVISVPSNLDITVADLSPLKFVNAEVGFGGSNPESNDSIRINAPKVLTTLNRAVSLVDYASLALSVPGVGANKAASYAVSPRSVVVYVGPEKEPAEQAWYPGFTDDNTEVRDSLIGLSIDVSDFLENKAQIGTYVTVLPPKYVDVNIVIFYERPTELSDALVQASIKKALFDFYGYDGVQFDTTVFPETIEAALKQNSNATRLKVQHLYLDSEENRLDPTRGPLIPGEGELFIFSDSLRDTEANLYGFEIYPFASLSNLTFSAGKVNKAFSPSTYAYSVTLPNATSTLTLTPTKVVDSDVVTYKKNGVVHSGGTFTSIPVTTKQTFEVIVTSEDASNVTTYKVTVTRKKA
jgi:hypothetical protein